MKKYTAGLSVLVGLLMILAAMPVSAGGPACPPPMCPPQMCGPAMCPPPMCGPMPCPPPRCGPKCDSNPLADFLRSTVKLAAAAIALPFKVVDSLVGGFDCPPKRSCRPVMACAPRPCPPPMCGPMPAMSMPMPACGPYMPPPLCGPPVCGHGTFHGGPVGFGYGAPMPMTAAKKTTAIPEKLIAAGAVDGMFGSYW